MPLRVDVATGDARIHREDVRLPGTIPLTIGRTYRSFQDEDRGFGPGWRLNVDVTLRAEPDRLVYAPGTLCETVFPPVEGGEEARHATGTILRHFSDRYVITPSADRRLVFEKSGDRNPSLLRLTRIEDRGENDLHFFYDGDQLVGIVDTVGRQVRLEYQGGTVRRLRLENNGSFVLRTFRYNVSGDLVEETDAEGYSASFEYHDHLIVEYTNRCGGTQYAQYDDERRCCVLWYEDGSQARRVAYDEARSTARIVGTSGRQTLYRYAPTDQVLEQIDPTDHSQNYYYNEAQQLIGFSNEHETVRVFRNLDPDEGLLTCVDGEEKVAFLEVDDALRVDAVTDAQDRQAVLDYEDSDRPSLLRTQSGAEWTFERDPRGSVTRVRSPMGHTVHLRRGPDLRTLVVEDEEGRLLKDHFDERGRLVKRTDGLGRHFQMRYDANGRLKSVKVASHTIAFEYNPEGHVTRVQGASGREYEFRYDAFGHLLERSGPQGSIRIDYGNAAHVQSIQDEEGRAVRYEIDDHNRVSRMVGPGERDVDRESDADGTLVTIDDAPGHTECRFNPNGDPVRWKRPDQPEHQFTYSPSGALLAAERGEESFSFLYGDHGLLQEAQMPDGALTFDYDRDEQLTTIERGDASVVTCRRDARGRPISVEVAEQRYEIEFDAGNRLRGIQSEDASWTLGYDALDHLTGGEGPGLSTISEEGAIRVPMSSNGSETSPAGVLSLHLVGSGVAISAKIEDACVPLWGQGAYAQPELPMSSALRAATMVRGADPLHELLTPLQPLERHQAWHRLVQDGLRWDYTGIPSRSDVQRPSWTVLNRFFLDRSFYARRNPTLVPGASFGKEPGAGRSPDGWTAGTHVEGVLSSSIWTDRSAGAHLHHAALGMSPGPKTPIDLLHANLRTMSW